MNTQDQREDRITIPSGEMEAPHDHILRSTTIRAGDATYKVPTIEQTDSGNCTEYSFLNAALMATEFGLPIGEDLQIYLGRHSLQTSVDNFEKGYALEIIKYLHEFPPGIVITPSDTTNLQEKERNIYASLTGTNATLLFWAMFNGLEKKISSNNVIQNSEEIGPLLRETPNLVVLEGGITQAHSTTTIKIEGVFFSIDTLQRPVLRVETEQEALHRLRRFLNGQNFIVVSKFETNE